MARIQATCSAKLATATALHSLFYILSHKLLFYNNRRLKAAGVLRPLLLPFATTDHFPFTRQSQTWNHVKTSNRYFFLSPHSWAAWWNVEGASMQNINSAKRKVFDRSKNHTNFVGKIWNYAIPVYLVMSLNRSTEFIVPFSISLFLLAQGCCQSSLCCCAT